MSRAPIALCLALLAGCRAAAPSGQPFSVEHRAALSDSVTAALEAYRATFVARDFDRTVAFYADDPQFRWYENGELRYGSKAAVAEALRAVGAKLRALELSYFETTVTPLAPGVAAVSTRFAEKVTDSTGVLHGYAGVFSATMVHADSGWRFLVGHTSIVVPEPTQKPR